MISQTPKSYNVRSKLAPSILLIMLLLSPCDKCFGEDPTLQEAQQTLKRAVEFHRQHVATHGGYLWRYSSDLSQREGENIALATTIWVQPPGTPSVGEAYLRAYQLTGNKFYLKAATETGLALVDGQLQSGGWDYRVEFDPAMRKRIAYRSDGIHSTAQATDKRNVTTLDDDTTQSAMRFLMRLDQTLQFKQEVIHEAVQYGLGQMILCQYPNGAWPQRFEGKPDEEKFPVKKAEYPDTWLREYEKTDYRHYYTLNDNTLADMIETMFAASRIYKRDVYLDSAKRAGDFILLAQMPAPQPAWAQQYNPDMQPAWARKFEPPAITGGESQGILDVLLYLYDQTGDRKYLQPIPKAVKYLQTSKLEDGRLPRFLELRTNKPLYFTRDYQLTYDNSDMPTHYSFIVGSKLERIERNYQQRIQQEFKPTVNKEFVAPRFSKSLADRAKQAIDSIDDRGAWLVPGKMKQASQESRIIDMQTYIKNINALSSYIAALKKSNQ